MSLDLSLALPLWPVLAGATPRLINHSENHTFLLDGPIGRFTLRVHRPDYQSVETIHSELAWLTALRADTNLPIPEPIPGADGQALQHFSVSGKPRHGVLFRFIAGSEPTPDQDLTGLFATIGNYAAQMHRHAIAWNRPAAFARQAWNAQTILDADGLWGNWRIAPGVDAANFAVIDRATERVRQDLADYGTARDRYGLIHADMRLGNLLVDGDKVSLIDFDDMGFCWFTYDFAAAISFHETHSSVPALKAAWLDGYQQVRPLHPADIASLDSMILLRRMALLAWIGSHVETTLAQTHMPGFAAGTADLAERYLARSR